MLRALIALATAAPIGLVACATENAATEPRDTARALTSKPEVDDQARNRILADRRAALEQREASRISACRGYFEDLYKRGVVDGLTYELTGVHLKAIRQTPAEEGRRQYNEGHLKGFCAAAGHVHASSVARPVQRSRLPYGLGGPAMARIEDMYAVSPEKCSDRLRDLHAAGAIGEATLILMAFELTEASQAEGDRYMRAGFVNGYCTAVSILWQGVVL